MANVDWIEIDSAVSRDQLVTILWALYPAAQIVRDSGRVALDLNENTALAVTDDSGSPYKHLIRIDDARDEAARHAVAREVYDGLAAGTGWGLLLTSDDEDEALAVRPAPAARTA